MQALLASQGWEFDVFICHAEPDRSFIAILRDEMQNCGLRTFVDIEPLKLEDRVQKPVAHAIVNSPFFVVVLSQNLLHHESEIEAALAFPKDHKKILPVFYQMSVDDCRQSNKELYRKLAAIRGLHKQYERETDEQFAERISSKVVQMAEEQHQSSNLPVSLLCKDTLYFLNGVLPFQMV